MKLGVSVLAGFLVGTLVFIFWQETRFLTALLTGMGAVVSTLGLQLFAENVKLKEKARGR